MTQTAPGLAALADAYDGFLLDQWGVLHDGARAYPGAVDAVERLVAAGKKVAVFSNQPRLADHVLAHMQVLGFARDLFAASSTGRPSPRGSSMAASPAPMAIRTRCLLGVSCPS